VKQNMHQGLGMMMNICEKGHHGQVWESLCLLMNLANSSS
jgi:hypothetical protein